MQLLKYFDWNKPTTVIWTTYRLCLSSIFHVSFMFLRVIVVFALFGHLVFGGANLSFLTIPISL